MSYQKNSLRYLSYNILLIGIQVLTFLIAIFISLGWVFTHGLCCADDGLFSTIPKNLALGYGYSSSLQENAEEYRITMFDTRIGTGPTSVLPSVMVIKLFGNKYWSPGLSNVLLWASVLLFTGIILNRIAGNPPGFTVAVFFFFTLSYFFTAYHVEHWYALLGELPAAFLILLALMSYFLKHSRVNLFYSGLFFSLATLAKTIAFLPFASFIIYIVISDYFSFRVHSKGNLKQSFHSLLMIILGFTIPIISFELWKIITLGFNGYQANFLGFISFIKDLGLNANERVIPSFSERVDEMRTRFGIFFPSIILALLFVGMIIKRNYKLFELFCSLLLIISIYSVYWLFFSIGWARYYIIALMLIIFCLVLPFLIIPQRKKWLSFYVLYIVGLLYFNTRQIDTFSALCNDNFFYPSLPTQSLLKVKEEISPLIGKEPLITQWWATAADVEYILDSSQNFSPYISPSFNPNNPFTIVVNSKFLDITDKSFMELLDSCDLTEIGKQDSSPYYYIIAKCN